MLPVGKRVGVLTADGQSLTPRYFEAVGAAGVPVAVQGMESYPEFRDVILEARRDDLDLDWIEAEIIAAAGVLVTCHDNVGAVVLECTDMPPFAHRIQAQLGLPVLDLTTLATMVHAVVASTPCLGETPIR